MTSTWQAPQALTHRNWHAAMAACQLSFQNAPASPSPKQMIDWQACQQIDSSAIAMILSLKRAAPQAVLNHVNVPAQLRQLAALYEVESLLGLNN